MNKAQRHLYRAMQIMNAQGLSFGADSDDDVVEVQPARAQRKRNRNDVSDPDDVEEVHLSEIAQRNRRNADRAQRNQGSKDVSDPRWAIVLDDDDDQEDHDAVVSREYEEGVEEEQRMSKEQKRRQHQLERKNAMKGGNKKLRQQYLQNQNAMAAKNVSLASKWKPIPWHLIQNAPEDNQPKDVGGVYLSDEFMPDVERNNAWFHNFKFDPGKYIKNLNYAKNYSAYQRDHGNGLAKYKEMYKEITVQQKCRDIRNLLDCGGVYQRKVQDLQSLWSIKPTDTHYRDLEQQTRRFLWGIAMFVSNWPVMQDEFNDIEEVGAFDFNAMRRDHVLIPTKSDHFIGFQMWDQNQTSRDTQMYYLHEKIGKYFNYRKNGQPAATKTVHPENMLDYFHEVNPDTNTKIVEPERFPDILMNSMSNAIHSLWADLFVTDEYKVRAIDDVLTRWLHMRREVYETMVGGCLEGTLRDIQEMFLRESTNWAFEKDKSKMENIRSLLSKLLCKWCDEAMAEAKSNNIHANKLRLDKDATKIILEGLTHHSLTELPDNLVREEIQKMKPNPYFRPLDSLPTYLFKGFSDSEILNKTTLYEKDRQQPITVSDIMAVVSDSGDTWLGMTPTDLKNELNRFDSNFVNKYSHVYAIKDKCIQANREGWTKKLHD